MRGGVFRKKRPKADTLRAASSSWISSNGEEGLEFGPIVTQGNKTFFSVPPRIRDIRAIRRQIPFSVALQNCSETFMAFAGGSDPPRFDSTIESLAAGRFSLLGKQNSFVRGGSDADNPFASRKVRIKSHSKLLRTAIHLFVLAVSVSAAAPWNSFRGPNSSGVASEGKPPIQFGPGTNLAFKVAVPAGASSPCIWENRIFLTGQIGARLQTLCLDADTGEVLWKKDAPGNKVEAYHSTEGSPAASTPATDGQHVVSYFGSRGVMCYDFSGTEIWRFATEPAVHLGGFGTGSSPLLADGLVLVNRDQLAGSKLLALKLATGEIAWEAARLDLFSSYSTPILWEHAGGKEIVVAGSLQLRGYDWKTGGERWRVRGLPPVTCTTPVVGDGMLIFAGWANGKAENALETYDQLLMALDKDSNGSVSPGEFASHSRFPTFLSPLMPMRMASLIERNGRWYASISLRARTA